MQIQQLKAQTFHFMKFCLPKCEAEALVLFKAIEPFTIEYLVNIYDILLTATREQAFTIGFWTWWLKSKGSKMHEKPILSTNFVKTNFWFARIYENTIC